MSGKFHYYVGLINSPWPIFSSLSSFNLFFSLFLFLKYGYLDLFCCSMILIMLTSYMWWRDYTREYVSDGGYSDSIDFCMKFSMVFFIGSEIFFFFSFFWSYFHFFMSPVFEEGFFWPPYCLLTFSSFNVPLLNTILLLSSGVTITVCHMMIINGDYKKSLVYLVLTVLLGFTFSFFQCLEYMSSFFCISDSNYGSIFFLLTGFHGMHVLIGTVFLLISMGRLVLFMLSSDHMLSFELCSWYWHFVDVVWIFLYFFVYYLVN
ncbi:cytochrome c oxidase subunit III (mitochondrion) [Fragariocoptes setiger]|uniref:Cytochrome c oxidase subunit 3 n=1 Tax=Fragariocoptes setiger TaxID=1670756 RepID=A0ABQ7SDE0_9ACAR|nr:cytochrome c oxidase subunit III [Fragariocoptes setiger]